MTTRCTLALPSTQHPVKSPRTAARLTCFHQQVSSQPELLELTVQLTAPARKQEAAQPPSTVLEHPVDRSSSLTLQDTNRVGMTCSLNTLVAGSRLCWSMSGVCAVQQLGRQAWWQCAVASAGHPAAGGAGRVGVLLTECLPATPRLVSRHLVVNTLMAPPKKYCTPLHPM